MLQLDIFRGLESFPDDFHFDKFELKDDQLYYKENDGKPLTTKKGNLRTVKELVKILGVKGLRNLGYNVPEGQPSLDFIKMKKAKEKLCVQCAFGHNQSGWHRTHRIVKRIIKNLGGFNYGYERHPDTNR